MDNREVYENIMSRLDERLRDGVLSESISGVISEDEFGAMSLGACDETHRVDSSHDVPPPTSRGVAIRNLNNSVDYDTSVLEPESVLISGGYDGGV